MVSKKVCKLCGGEIENDRLAVLDTPICARCASKEPGNILNVKAKYQTVVRDIMAIYTDTSGSPEEKRKFLEWTKWTVEALLKVPVPAESTDEEWPTNDECKGAPRTE